MDDVTSGTESTTINYAYMHNLGSKMQRFAKFFLKKNPPHRSPSPTALHRLFSSYLVPLGQNKSSCKTIRMKICSLPQVLFHANHSFPYEWFCTKTRFETEAQGNSEMAYSPVPIYTPMWGEPMRELLL